MSKRTVYIPVVQPGGDGSGDRLVECYSEASGAGGDEAGRAQALELDIKARDKDWDPIAAPLRKAGLYQAGCVAAGAVRKIGLKRPFGALYQMIRPRNWIERQRLHASGAAMLTEGNSAQLGLALVLLLAAAGSSRKRILATGALGGQPPGSRLDDVMVEEVGSVPAKLRMLLRMAEAGALPEFGPSDPLLLFTPTHHTEDGVRQRIADLAEIAALERAHVQVMPVETLSEAIGHLNIRRARMQTADRLLQAASVLVLAAVSAAFGYHVWRTAPIAMEFIAPTDAARAEPFQVCYTSDGRYWPLPLIKTGVVPTIDDGATIAWRLQVGRREDTDGLTGSDGYWVGQLMLSEFSAAKAVSPRLPGQSDYIRIEPGGTWEWSWELEDREETSMLILLSQRHARIDADKLRRDLVETFPEAATDARLDVTAAANFITARMPGAVTFIFQTRSDRDRCRV